MSTTWRATWKGETLAESSDTVEVEGNQYFPEADVNWMLFTESSTTSVCPWKGTASYYSVNVDGSENQDAAWVYPEPKEAAQQIAGHVAFWKGVSITKV